MEEKLWYKLSLYRLNFVGKIIDSLIVNVVTICRWKFGFKIDAWNGAIQRNENYWQLVVRGSKLCQTRTIRIRTWATLTAIGNGWIWAMSVHWQVRRDWTTTQTTRTKKLTSRDKIIMESIWKQIFFILSTNSYKEILIFEKKKLIK